MTPSNQIPAVCNYGTSAVYSDYPSPEQMRAGVVPLDSLPAAWWNKMWCASNCAINEARDMVGQIITEVNNVLCQAGINPQAACTDQLYQSINKIRQTLATASVPGAVVSSSTASEVAVDPTTGRMTVNCLGNAASLSTSASTVVGAINELKSTYDCCFSDTATALNGKAPTSHASSATTYGVGSADNYGHLKISDTYTSVLAACSGVAASQMALACVYAVAAAAAAGNISLGNTAGCALGTAAAGTAITAARSDHVHPKQTLVDCACKGPSGTAFGSAAYCAATAFRASTWTPSLVSCSCYNYIDAYTASADRGVVLTCAVTAAGQYQTLGPSVTCKFTFNPATGEVKAKTFTGALAGCACCAGRDSSGCAFGTAARYACGCFRSSSWWPNCTDCGCVNYAACAYCSTFSAYATDSAGLNGYSRNNIINDAYSCGLACWVYYCGFCYKLLAKGTYGVTINIENMSTCISACCMGKFLACLLGSLGYSRAATTIGSTVINPNYSNAMTLYWVGMSECTERQALTTLANCRLRRCVGDGNDMPLAPYAAGTLSFSVS